MTNIVRMKKIPIRELTKYTRDMKKTLLSKYPGSILIVKRNQNGLNISYDWISLEEVSDFWEDNTILENSSVDYSPFDLSRCGFLGTIGHRCVDPDESTTICVGAISSIDKCSDEQFKNTIQDTFENEVERN